MWVSSVAESPRSVRWVIEHMREWDRTEIFATRTSDDNEAFMAAVEGAGSVSWVVGDDGPIAVFGCAPMWPGVWSMWLFATDEFPQIGLSVTKMIVRSIVPMLWDAGAHRLQCHSIEGHVDAQRWLGVIGARRESTLPAYGKGKEDFHLYVWDKP